MKHIQQIIPMGAKTTFVEVWCWGQELERLNGWQLAEHAGESHPDGMQWWLNSAVWDSDLMRDDLRNYILECLGDPGAVVVIDETSFRKRGKHSAGVGMQHCGTIRQVENCLVGVFLDYLLRHFSRPHAEYSISEAVHLYRLWQ